MASLESSLHPGLSLQTVRLLADYGASVGKGSGTGFSMHTPLQTVGADTSELGGGMRQSPRLVEQISPLAQLPSW